MVRKDLADIHLTNTIEVVAHIRVHTAGNRRVECFAKIEYLRKQIFDIVRKTIAIVIRIGITLESVEFFPPIDESVAIGVRRLDIILVYSAVRLHTLREVTQVRLPCGDFLAVVVNKVGPSDCGRIATIELFPPIRESIRIRVRHRIFPRRRRAQVIPHRRARLRIGVTTREEVARHGKAATDCIKIAINNILNHGTIGQLFLQLVKFKEAHCAVNDTHLVTHIGVRGITQIVHCHTRLTREHTITAQVLRIDKGIRRATIENWQVVDHVRNPCRDIFAIINGILITGIVREQTEFAHALILRRLVHLA